MGRFRSLLPFKPHIDTWTLRTINHTNNESHSNAVQAPVNYFYVKNGFFKLRMNQNSVSLTVLHILAIVALVELFMNGLYDLLIVGE